MEIDTDGTLLKKRKDADGTEEHVTWGIWRGIKGPSVTAACCIDFTCGLFPFSLGSRQSPCPLRKFWYQALTASIYEPIERQVPVRAMCETYFVANMACEGPSDFSFYSIQLVGWHNLIESGYFPEIQWLRDSTLPMQMGKGFIPGQGTKILHATQRGQKWK